MSKRLGVDPTSRAPARAGSQVEAQSPGAADRSELALESSEATSPRDAVSMGGWLARSPAVESGEARHSIIAGRYGAQCDSAGAEHSSDADRFESSSEPYDGGEKRDFWRHLFNGELFEIGQRLTPEHLATTVDAAQSVGEGLRNVWSDLRNRVGSLLDLPEVEQRLSPEAREQIVKTVMQTARGLGYTAAGVQGVGGLYKLREGFRQDSLEKKLDGAFDLTTSAAVGTAIAGLGAVPLVLGPLAAATGVVRGGFNAYQGFRTNDTRAEVQGALDATRSASIGFRLLGNQVGMLGAVGMVLAPIAGVIQLGRGAVDLSSGLAEEVKEKQVQGLSDIAAAVGLTASLTGIGTVPGLALVAAAMGGRVLYQFNERFQGWADEKLDQRRPQLEALASGIEKVTQPALKLGRWVVEKVTGKERGDEPEAEAPDKATNGSAPNTLAPDSAA